MTESASNIVLLVTIALPYAFILLSGGFLKRYLFESMSRVLVINSIRCSSNNASTTIYASDAVYCGLVCHTSYTTPTSWSDNLEKPEKPLNGLTLIPDDS